MFDLGEIWKTLRTTLLTDATLVGMLGQPDGIFREFPRDRVTFPILVIEPESSNPQPVSAPGLWRPAVRIDIYTADPYKADAIDGRLRGAWSIPETRTTEIASDHLRLTQLQFGTLRRIGLLRVIDTDEDVTRFSIACTTRVIVKAAE